MLTELTVNEFAARLASSDPAPGGGSAAALSGLIGVSLLEMVINLSQDRPEYAAHSEFLAAKKTELARVHSQLTALIDRDAQAFQAVMAAFGLPKSSDEGKHVRMEAIQKAAKQAAEIPLETARACLEVLEIANRLIDRTNPNALSDLMCAALSGQAGLTGALLNATVNLSMLANEALVRALSGQIHLVRSTAEELMETIQKKVYGREVFAALWNELEEDIQPAVGRVKSKE